MQRKRNPGTILQRGKAVPHCASLHAGYSLLTSDGVARSAVICAGVNPKTQQIMLMLVSIFVSVSFKLPPNVGPLSAHRGGMRA